MCQVPKMGDGRQQVALINLTLTLTPRGKGKCGKSPRLKVPRLDKPKPNPRGLVEGEKLTLAEGKA